MGSWFFVRKYWVSQPGPRFRGIAGLGISRWNIFIFIFILRLFNSRWRQQWRTWTWDDTSYTCIHLYVLLNLAWVNWPLIQRINGLRLYARFSLLFLSFGFCNDQIQWRLLDCCICIDQIPVPSNVLCFRGIEYIKWSTHFEVCPFIFLLLSR